MSLMWNILRWAHKSTFRVNQVMALVPKVQRDKWRYEVIVILFVELLVYSEHTESVLLSLFSCEKY